MAEKIRGITIEIGGDTKGLTKSLQSVNREVKSTQSQLRDVEKLLKFDPGNTELLAQKQQLLAKAAKESADKVEELYKIEKQMKDAGVDENSEQFMALRREIIEAEGAAKNYKEQLDNLNSVKLEAISAQLDQVGQKLTTAGQSMTKNVTLPIVAGFTAAVKTASDFDTSMSQVAAVSGATAEEFDVLRDKAREMGATTKFSASDAADAMNYMAMAGWKAEDMLDGIEGIMNLAAASGEELATVSDIVTDALTAFGYTAADSGRFADVLAAASSNANTNVAMLGESFKYVAPVAGALGYNVEDVATALGLMANSGIKAGTAGAALRTLLSNMAKPTDDMYAAMEKLGVSLEDDEGNMKSLAQVMRDFRRGFGKLKMPIEQYNEQLAGLNESYESGALTEEQFLAATEELAKQAYGAEGALKAQYAATIAGTRGMSALLSIVNATDEDFEKLEGAIYGAEGAAANMSEIMQDNLAGQLQILKSQIAELGISIGDTLMPIVRDVVSWMQKIIDKFNQLSPEQKETIVTILGIVAAIGPLLIVMGKIATSISAIIALWPKIKAIGLAIKTFAAANPIVLIAAAVTAFVLLIATQGEKIKEILQKVDAFLKNIFAKDFTEIFGPVLGNILNSFMATFSNIWDGIKKIFTGIIDFIRGVFTGNWKQAWEGLKGILSGVWNTIVGIVKAPINAIIGLINGVIGAINSMIRGLNNIRFNIPDWVPFLGGKSFGLNIREIGRIPYLANGGVVSEGSAVVGEAGPELLTMMNGKAVVQPLGANNNTTNTTNLGGVNITVYGAPGQDVRQLADIIMDEMQAATERRAAALA